MIGFLESPKRPSKSFLKQTALDYDLDVSTVEYYYDVTGGGLEFYRALEYETGNGYNF